PAEISLIEKGDSVTFTVDSESLSVSKEDVEILSEQISGWIVESEGGVTVAVDTQLTEDLISEGVAREFVNRIQNMRKDAGFQVTDKIKIAFNGSDAFVFAINTFSNYISAETLAEKIESNVELNGGFVQDWKIGGDDIKIKIEKISI
ncbi:MAG: ileS, partial [Ignavibacteriaceae bacterium]|nr:ileS [Ignavibacteriaceae bacterium]